MDMKQLITDTVRNLPDGAELRFCKYLNGDRVVVIHRWDTGAQPLVMPTLTFNDLGEPAHDEERRLVWRLRAEEAIEHGASLEDFVLQYPTREKVTAEFVYESSKKRMSGK